MPMPGSLHTAFIDELRDTYDAEKQITKALPRVAKAASSPQLRAAFEQHIQETRGQIERLTRVFESLGEKARGKHCDGMAGILEEASSALKEDAEDATMDALLIASAQRVEHYEMAAYGTLVAWAEAMGHDEAARLLRETLEEEKATDDKLTSIAEGGINRNAAARAHGGDAQANGTRASGSAGGRQGRSANGRMPATAQTTGTRSSAAAATGGVRRAASRSTTRSTGARKR